MSRIDDLIAEHCPDGVEFKALGDIGELTRGRRFTKGDVVPVGLRSIHYGEIYTRYSTSTTTTFSQVRADLAPQLRFARPGDVVIAAVGETVEDVGKAVAWLGDGEVAVHDDCFVFRHSLNPKFVSYLFQTSMLNAQKTKYVARAKVKRLSGESLSKLRIPVPPSHIQREIVRILDAFTELEADLEAELEAEREARRRQYEFYRTVVLLQSADNSEWQEVHLRDVADILVGFAFKSARFSANPADARLVRGDNIGQGVLKRGTFKHWHRSPDDGLGRYELLAGDVVLAMDRPWIPAGLKWAGVEHGDLPALLVQRVARLRGESGVLHQQYLGCVISSARFTAHVLANQTGNTVPHISGTAIGEFAFTLPPLAEQIKFAATLEGLDMLASDLSVALPAELNARQKQYQYYRDRLLTFEEAPA